MADSYINFNTKINTDGFDKGSKDISSKALEIERKIKNTKLEIQNLTKALKSL